MKTEKTLKEKLHSRHIKRPPAVIYPLLGKIWKLMYYKKLGMTVNSQIDIDNLKGPFIVLSNHASRMDYIYVGIPFLRHRINFVAWYNEFFRSHLTGVFHLLQIIPKRNFYPDLYTIRQISRIINQKGMICIFPEGMNSISGANQPVALGTAKLLKHYKAPVYYTKISGGYLTNTKYCLDERYGKVEIEVDQMFTPEELANLSEEEVTDIVNTKLYNDDFEWNKTARIDYKGNGRMAHSMGDLLYYCPKCHAEYTMKGEGDKIVCEKCGNGATVTSKYDLIPLDDSCVIPETPKKWHDMQRELLRKEINENPDYELREKVKLGVLPKHKHLKNLETSLIVGEGEVSICRKGFSYVGTMDGQPFSFTLATDLVPTYGMCTDITRFYTFYKGDFYEFYPENSRVMKFFIATEEVHRANGGKWTDFKNK